MDELIELGNNFRDEWNNFEKEQLEYCNENLKKIFEMKRRAYIKHLGGSTIINIKGDKK